MSNEATPNSSFEELTFRALLGKYDKILVPMIQRDYAQGRVDKKAQEVRSTLLNDIFDSSKGRIHFDLIFGSKETRIIDGHKKSCFIPVDGQQRLTTLFLLYLYQQKIYSVDTELELSKFGYDTRRAALDFCTCIVKEKWAIVPRKKISSSITDSIWFMDYWKDDPTVAGMLTMLDAIQEKDEVSKPFPELERIKFIFYDLDSNGLNENLYLKMNSRGKPLTAFENLKASIENLLPDKVQGESGFPKEKNATSRFKELWKYYIDRDWINRFWNSNNPESTDTYITAFIVRFLSGFWNAFGREDTTKISDSLKDINNQEKNYANFIPFECIKPILKIEGVFPKLASAFNALKNIKQINNYWNADDKLHEYKTIAVIFSYVFFKDDSQAMRFACNMSENTVTGYDTFISYCKHVAEILRYWEKEEHANKNFYKILSSIRFDNPSEQLKEEIAKVRLILNGSFLEDDIKKAESHPLLKGCIRALFEDDNCNTVSFGQSLQERLELLTKLHNETDEKDYTLVKRLVLLCKSDYKPKRIQLKKNISNWKELITDKFKDSFRQYCSTTKNNSTITINDWRSMISHTDLIENSRDDGKILGTYRDRIVLWATSGCNWNAYQNIILDCTHYNPMLAQLVEEKSIRCSQKVNGCDFFWGWNIDFEYSDHYFRWWAYPKEKELDIYLMENDWADYKERPNPTSDKGTDEDNYYCFRVTEDVECDTSKFIDALDILVKNSEEYIS